MSKHDSYTPQPPSYVINTELAGAQSNGVLLYAGIPVSNERGVFTMSPGNYNVNGTMEYITSKKALEIWQQVYLHVRNPFDPEDCAYVFRETKGICHTCKGDAVLDNTDEICPDCKGTGHNFSSGRG